MVTAVTTRCTHTAVRRLLFRFYDASSGSVRVGGHDVRELTLKSLRHAIAQVPQVPNDAASAKASCSIAKLRVCLRASVAFAARTLVSPL